MLIRVPTPFNATLLDKGGCCDGILLNSYAKRRWGSGIDLFLQNDVYCQ